MSDFIRITGINMWPTLFMSVILFVLSSSLIRIQAQETLLNTVKINGEKGLSLTNNEYIVKDSYGWVWISSLDGLNIYNGTSVQVFRPSNSDITGSVFGLNIQSSFFEDLNGDVWFTTESALNCFRRKTARFEHFFFDGKPYNQGDSETHYAFLMEAKRFLWVGAADQLFRFDTKNPYSSSSRQYLHSLKPGRCNIECTEDGKVKRLINGFWDLGKGMEVIHYTESLQVFSRDTLFSFDQTNNGRIIPALTIRSSVIMRDGTVWAATSRGLLKLQENCVKGFRFSLPTSGKSLRRVYKKSESALWIVSDEGLIYTFDIANGTFSRLASESDPTDLIDAVFVSLDDQHVLWRSIKGLGVLHNKLIDKPLFQNCQINLKSGMKNIVQLYEPSPNQVVCLNAKGEGALLDAYGQQLKRVQLWPYSKFSKYSGSKAWLLSNAGLGTYDFKTDQFNMVWNDPDLIFYDMTGNISRDLLVGTDKELYWVSGDGASRKQLNSVADGVLKISFGKHCRLWTANVKEKIQCWQFAGENTSRKLFESRYSGLVNHIVEDTVRNVVWVGMNKGLLKIWETNGVWYDSLITERDGLPNQYIYAIVPDKKGALWLSTNHGIVKYQPENPMGSQFKQFTVRNGLTSNEYNPGASLMSQNGEIWFGSTKGIDVFYPDSLEDIGTAPQLALISLKIHDQLWKQDTMNIDMAKRIVLPYDENTLRFELAAMEYTDPELNKFRVWLSRNGGKADTVELGTQNFITYANLAPGKYRFGFTACNTEGIWQKIPHNLDIIIRPPYWETWWFRLFIIGLVLGLVGFGTAFYYRYRLRVQQMELERQQMEADRKQLLLENELALQLERNRIADEMHDELGGGLSTIRLASERAKKINAPDELKTIMNRVSQISIGLIGNMRGIIWAMDTQNDSLDSLLSYLRQYTRTFLDDNSLIAHIRMPDECPGLNLSGQYRHSLMLTVKECLNNILKHSGATEVWLDATVDSELTLRLRDNGSGFDPDQKIGSGKGLRTTAKRMQSVGGSIQWERNEDDLGMTTTIRSPLTHV
ncbi:MAG: two-component regulator propeller domain-containing protein [Bacteroidota bacterium]|uniref:sensor histidine kinase n=1 Tax=Runella sp. TaxID=1960881 RepID=UPI003016EDB1